MGYIADKLLGAAAPTREVDAAAAGMAMGFDVFAYMKDGVYYVGTTGETLANATVEVEAAATALRERWACDGCYTDDAKRCGVNVPAVVVKHTCAPDQEF